MASAKEIFLNNHKLAKTIAKNRRWHPESLEDTTQYALLGLWKGAHSFDSEKSSLKTWLIQSVLYAIGHYVRFYHPFSGRHYKFKEVFTSPERLHIIADPQSLEDYVIHKVYREEMLKIALVALTQEERNFLFRSMVTPTTELAEELNFHQVTISRKKRELIKKIKTYYIREEKLNGKGDRKSW